MLFRCVLLRGYALEKVAKLGRILNVSEGAKRPVDVCSAPTATE